MLAGTAEAIKVGAGAKTKLKSLERAKNKVRSNDKTPERHFLWDNLPSFGHHNTLRSSIKANIIRTVTMETLGKIILPKYGH